MAITTITASPGTMYLYTTKYVTSNNSWWVDTPFDPTWEELYQQKIKSQANKCSVQEPPRKKNIRFLNRPA